MVRPRAAEFGALLGEQSAYLVDAFEVTVAEAVQPVADFGFELKVVQSTCLVAHVWSDYRDRRVRLGRNTILAAM